MESMNVYNILIVVAHILQGDYCMCYYTLYESPEGNKN